MVHSSNSAKFRLSLWSGLTGVASSFGFLECARLLWFEWTVGSVPCDPRSCSVLESGIRQVPGFGSQTLAIAGLAYFGMLLTAWLIWVTSSRHRPLKLGRNLSVLGALLGTGLLGYGYLEYGSFCKWCVASVLASYLYLAGALNLCDEAEVEGSGLRGVSRLGMGIASFAVALLLLTGLERYERQFGLDLDRVTQAARDESFGRNRAFARGGEPDAGHLMAFVDFDCQACVNALTDLRKVGVRYQTSLHFVKDEANDVRPSSLLFLDARSPEESSAILEGLLSSARASNAQYVSRTRTQLGLPSEPSSEAVRKLKQDAELARAVRIHITPTFVLVKPNGNATPISLEDLKAQSPGMTARRP